MKTPRSTYVPRGEAWKRRRKFRRLAIFTSITGAALLVIANRQPSEATADSVAESSSSSSFSFGILGENRRLRKELANALGESALLRAQIDRSNRIIDFSTRYGITANLAATIFDVALEERLDPELAFRLVKLESNFNVRATSKVGAIGLAQVMLSTAVQFDKTVTGETLYDPQTNLKIGFQYLRRLIGLYGGDVRLALLAYNLGEARVDQARAAGKDPLEGYNRILLKAYQGSGVSN
jgi:soluble lytic murein transglycosylase-like protein